MADNLFGYIRVSTIKQGQQGVSLLEQRDAILRYASKRGAQISSWFEEQETAAKRGRPVFSKMLKMLRQRQANGVVLHKIDRGARNLKDWSDIAELIDTGIEVHFANESIDMRSRGGRLSADIQAVVAADFIRNLREETRKGFFGRLKQGLYPLSAPIGYIDKGKGKAKEPDPMSAPFVRKAFDLYSTAKYSLDTLLPELHQLGLRNKKGGPVSRNGLSRLLNNPFYMGLIRLRQSGEMFVGVHSPLVTKSIFDRVQLILQGKTNTRLQKHRFLFRRLLQCGACNGKLVGERQKGHQYYRCHGLKCPGTSVREETVEIAIQEKLSSLRFSEHERLYFKERLASLRTDWVADRKEAASALNLRLGQIKERLNRLTDALLDGVLDRTLFDQRKSTLLIEQKEVEERLANSNDEAFNSPERVQEFFELCGSAWLSYQMGISEEKRDLLEVLTSNRTVFGKDVAVELSFPFSEISERHNVPLGDPHRDIPRTFDRLLDILTAASTHGQLPSLKAVAGGEQPVEAAPKKYMFPNRREKGA